MDSFTPLTASIGGCLIGLAAAVLWLGNGRIAGVAGIFGHVPLWIFLGTMFIGSFAGRVVPAKREVLA